MQYLALTAYELWVRTGGQGRGGGWDFFLLLSVTFTLSIWPASFIKKYLSLSEFSNWLKRLVWNKLGKWIIWIKNVAWQMLCWLCKPTEIEPQKSHLESCVKRKSVTTTTPSVPLSRRTHISVPNAGTYSSAIIDTSLDGYIWSTPYICLIKISVLTEIITTGQKLNRYRKIKKWRKNQKKQRYKRQSHLS